MSHLKVVVVFDDQVRPDTTGIYCLSALQKLANVTHRRPSDLAGEPSYKYDLALYVDDGMNYPLRGDLAAVTALWAIDTHLNPQRIVQRGQAADLVFVAQKDAVDPMRSAGLQVAGWLPLAADPERHRHVDVQQLFDVTFIAHFNTAARVELAGLLQREFPASFIGQRFFDDLCDTCSRGRTTVNLSVRHDVNMRVFESLAMGATLLTNDLSQNGLHDLFIPGEHLVVFHDINEVPGRVRELLNDDVRRERIAAAGRQCVLDHHTYRHRMQVILEHSCRRILDSRRPPNANLTSIVIATCNNWKHTAACIASVERCTPEEHEIIVVDNGSTDGTAERLRKSSVRLIENSSNRGFPAAVNQGIVASKGNRIVLLNNDTIVTPGWLSRMHRAIYADAVCGLVGPCSNRVSGSQQVTTTYSDPTCTEGDLQLREYSASRQLLHDGARRPSNRLVGFCLMVRREVFLAVGLLDERFGIGNFEDDDLCRRAAIAGFSACIADDAFVHHVGSATFAAEGFDIAEVLDRSRLLYEAKWRSMAVAARRADISVKNTARLSLCMIVRDSARTLRPCLKSIAPWVDEMIVVDTGSTDNTIAIAREYGAFVSEIPWPDSFAAARNVSLERATGDWLFWMDADDTIPPDHGRRLRELISGEVPASLMGYIMRVQCPSMPSQSDYSTPTVVDHVKVIRNRPDIRFSGRIHEQLMPAIRAAGGEVAWTDLSVLHSGSDQSSQGRARKHARDLRLLHLELCDHPDSTFAHFNLGMTLLDAGRPAEALDSICRSLQLADDHESHVRKLYAFLAQCYVALQRPDTALRAIEKGLRLLEDDVELLFRRGLLLQQMRRLPEAAKSYEAIVRKQRPRVLSSVDLGLSGVKAWHNLAIVREQMGDSPRAAEAWEHVLEASPGNAVAMSGLADARRAMTVAL